ncbi:hypothetical protein IQ07DRAFT_512737 [Pyrenochaeta sp. DS3sAY3a]|nr:hypothetical protein IQ07DRAFT_512737 [Pyrenochaeta sp. DS3sAY3a]
MASSAESNLYPKITNHITDVVKTLQHINRNPDHPEEEVHLDPIPLIGTIKLHGTHADILIHPNNTIVFQSRNVANLAPEKDNQGFATAMSKKTKILLRLRDLYLARWAHLNPTSSLDPTHPVLIAGEWIGQSIQSHVAIAQLTKRFVIISIHINGSWQPDTDYSGISLPAHDIYNISRAGIYHGTLYPSDPARTAADLEPVAERIAAHCPFAATFGVHGAGEGLVWKPASAPYNGTPALWFKTKGGRFKPTFARPPKKSMSFDTVAAHRALAADVAGVWCSAQRLEQGWDVLREKGVERGMRAIGEYLKWVQADVLGEERGFIEKYGVHEGQLKLEIAKIAKAWFVGRVAGGEGEEER